jgi:restriction endonuclease S subunit
MYYYLLTIQNQLLNIAKGVAQLGINQENFYKIKIPIPSLEQQEKIINYCVNNNNLIKHLENEIEQNKKLAEKFILNIIKKNYSCNK